MSRQLETGYEPRPDLTEEAQQADKEKRGKERVYAKEVDAYTKTGNPGVFSTREGLVSYLRGIGLAEGEISKQVNRQLPFRNDRQKSIASEKLRSVLHKDFNDGKITKVELDVGLKNLNNKIAREDQDPTLAPGSGPSSISGQTLADLASGNSVELLSNDYITKAIASAGRTPSSANYEGELSDLRELEKEKSKAEGKLYGIESEYYGDQAERLKRHEDARLAIQERRDEASKKVTAAIDLGMSDLRTLKVNPFRVFKNSWASLGAAIATAMGAYAQGISGNRIPNTALEIINKAQQMDVQAQVTEYNNAKDKLTLANNIYAKMMTQFGTEEDALNATLLLQSKAMEYEMKKKAAAGSNLVKIIAQEIIDKKYSVDAALNKQKLEESMIARQTGAYLNAAQLQQSANNRGMGSSKRAKDLKKTLASATSLERILDNMETILNKEWPEGYFERHGAATYAKAREEFPGVTNLFSPFVSEEVKASIAKLGPNMASNVFKLVGLLDPNGRISDADVTFFTRKGFSWDDTTDGAWRHKMGAWRQIIKDVKDIARSGNTSELFNSDGTSRLKEYFQQRYAGSDSEVGKRIVSGNTDDQQQNLMMK